MLDTDTCIFVIRNRPPEMRQVFNAHSEHLSVSSVTLAELYFGAEKSDKPDHNLRIVEGFVARLVVHPFDEDAAAHYGQIRAVLARSGQTIGPYDLMIAGHARSKGLVLVTNNLREFTRVEGLRLENWMDHTVR